MSTSPRSGAARRDWGSDDSATPILHVDMDSFFASVEIALNPSLRNRPLIVGGHSPRAVVTSATYDVRSRGVRAGMPMAKALRLAPAAVVVNSHLPAYREYSARVMTLLREVTAQVEVVSIDEAYLDVAGARRRLGSPVQIATAIRTRIRTDIGLPASVGIGATKTVAKIASSHAKPDGMLLVPASATVDFLHCLPVGALPGVGKRSQEVLARAGIETVAELAATTQTRLERLLGASLAHHLRAVAAGVDRRKVETKRVEKSVGTEETFPYDYTQMAQLLPVILAQSHDCARRLRAQNLVGWTVSIKVRAADFTTVTRALTLPGPTDSGKEIATCARRLLQEYGVPQGGVRLVGVRIENLHSRSAGVPVRLDERGDNTDAERAMDRIQARFGRGAIAPATLLVTPTRAASALASQVPCAGAAPDRNRQNQTDRLD